MFQMTNFECFLESEKPSFNVIFIHVVLLHIFKLGDSMRELWFRLNRVNVWFSPIEFALVTSLFFRHDTKLSNYVDYEGTPLLKE